MQGLQQQIGKRIRTLREQKGISQEALADICNLHRTYVGLIERGKRNLSLKALEVIAQGLGVSISDLTAGLERTDLVPRRFKKRQSSPLEELTAHVAAIRQVLIEAKLTDARRYRTLLRASRQNRKAST